MASTSVVVASISWFLPQKPQPFVGGMPLPWIMLSDLAVGTAVSSAGLALSRSLSAVQIVADAFGGLGGIRRGLDFLEPGFDATAFATFGWTLLGLGTVLLMAVARSIQRP